MVTRKHAKITAVLTIVFAVMTLVSLVLFIAGIWTAWAMVGSAIAMNSLALCSHVFMDVALREEIYDDMQTNAGILRNEIEVLRMALVYQDSMTKLRKDYLTGEAANAFISLVHSDKSPLKDDIHLYSFRLGAIYDGNPVFVTVPVNISNPRKNITDLEPKQFLNFLAEEITPTAAKLVVALLKDRDGFKFGRQLTVDIIPAEK